jgi:hypothetical protein
MRYMRSLSNSTWESWRITDVTRNPKNSEAHRLEWLRLTLLNEATQEKHSISYILPYLWVDPNDMRTRLRLQRLNLPYINEQLDNLDLPNHAP